MPFLANIAGAGFGYAASREDAAMAREKQQQALQQWLSVNVPDPSKQALYLQQYQQTGTLNPELEQAIKASPSEMQNITQDPKLQAAQMQALQQLQNEGAYGGTTLQDQAAIQQQNIQSDASARGRNAAIQNSFGAQGLGGSGLQLQAQLQNSQNANQTEAMRGLQGAADSRSRALQAVMGAGELGGQMANTQYQQQANLAKAKDYINQFNTQNTQNVQNRNVQNANTAQQYNLGLKQQVSNANTGLQNSQQAYNKGLLQQQYQNQLQKTQGAANAQLGYGNYLQGQAANTANMWAGIGSGVGKGLSAYQQNSKQNQGESQGAPASNTNFGYGGQAATAGDDEDLFGNFA